MERDGMRLGRRLAVPGALLAVLVLAAFEPWAGTGSDASGAAEAPQQGTGVVAFVDVNVVPMDRDRILENHTVVVRDGRIAAVGPAAGTAVPEGAVRVDGRGKYLMPGIAEMHGHVPGGNADAQWIENVLFLFVANGVTTVRGMQGHPSHLELRDRIERGEILGPRFFPSGPPLSGQSVRTVEDARRIVREQKDAGFALLKVHEGLSREVYDAIAETAHQVGIPFGGHVSDLVGLRRALEARQSTVDHLDNYGDEAGDDASAIAAIAEATRAAGTWVVPTMELWDVFNGREPADALLEREELRYMPGRMVEGWANSVRSRTSNLDPAAGERVRMLRRRILKALADADAGILLGSDAPQLFSVPGFSLHREMRVMIEAGMTPYQVLRSGTVHVAAHFGLLDEAGTIETGKRADLILLDGNPLQDVGNVARRAGVMVNGRWLPEAEIQARLDRIAAAAAN